MNISLLILRKHLLIRFQIFLIRNEVQWKFPDNNTTIST